MNGARTQPCFIPTSTGKLEDWDPAITTWAHMPVWNSCSIAIKVGEQPNLRRMFQRRSRLTVSNAFVRSTKAMHKSWCCSRHFFCSCRTTNIISIVLRPRRNPHCDSGKTRSTMCSRRRVSMILASTLPATERREMPRLLPHSARSPICLCTRIMLASFHCCGRHVADQQSRMKLCSLLCTAQLPYLMTSGGMLSGPAALLSLSLRISFSTSSKDGRSSSIGMNGSIGRASRKPGSVVRILFSSFCRHSAHLSRFRNIFLIK